MARQREIFQLGAPVLRQIAEPVVDIASDAAQDLISDMLYTLEQSQGVGLAAPQIGESEQIIIIASRPTERYPSAPLMQATVMINPVFETVTDDMAKDWEGCLSIPGIRALVPRYTKININYLNVQGQRKEYPLTDFVARVFQHEYDHLLGKVYLDRVEDNQDIISESEFFKLIEKGRAIALKLD